MRCSWGELKNLAMVNSSEMQKAQYLFEQACTKAYRSVMSASGEWIMAMECTIQTRVEVREGLRTYSQQD